jgi:hypothetical protein
VGQKGVAPQLASDRWRHLDAASVVAEEGHFSQAATSREDSALEGTLGAAT